MIKYIIATDENTEEDAVKRAMMADDAFACLYDIKQRLRDLWKYNDYEHEETIKVIDDLWEFFHDRIAEHAVYLDVYYR